MSPETVGSAGYPENSPQTSEFTDVPLISTTKPLAPLATTLDFFQDQWGTDSIGLLLTSGLFYSAGYNRWQINRTERIVHGTGFEPYFAGLIPFEYDALDSLRKMEGFYTGRVLDIHTHLVPHDRKIDLLLKFLHGEKSFSLGFLPTGFDLFGDLRTMMRHLPYHGPGLSAEQIRKRAEFQEKTRILGLAALPVSMNMDLSNGVAYQTCTLPKIKSEFEMPVTSVFGKTDRDLILDLIGILGQPIFYTLQQLPPVLFEHIPYGPPRGSPKREFLESYTTKLLLEALPHDESLPAIAVGRTY